MSDFYSSARCPKNMVYIPGGTFVMGSRVGYSNERPMHEVAVSALCWDKHEFTNSDYALLAAKKIISIVSPPRFSAPRQPLVNVNWFQAKLLCELQGKRLPREAEWEYAASGPHQPGVPKREFATETGLYEEQKFHFGLITSSVCSYPPNKNGLCDLTGNVAEWVSDWYGRYPSVEMINPRGPSDGVEKVIRGGAWLYLSPNLLTTTSRLSAPPGDKHLTIGFRCVTSPNDMGDIM